MPSSTASTRVLVLGAGKIGRLVTRLLADDGAFEVTVADAAAPSAQAAARTREGEPLERVTGRVVDCGDARALGEALVGHAYVVSCAPFHLNRTIAEAARERAVHYLDLTEDVETTKLVRGLARGSERCFIPQCGLAPGFVSIVAAETARGFDTLDSVKLRVGALPLYPNNRLMYNLSWSTEGLINEYGNPCEAVVDGQLVTTRPLEALESLSVDGIGYEAFNTSGGLGTLAESWAGRVANLDYKSIRYPGHRELVAFLMRDLKFNEDRETLKRVLERSIPYAWQDVVLIFVGVSGHVKGRYTQESYVKKIYNDEVGGEPWSAIQITTASSVCTVLDLHLRGKLPARGFVRQEDIAFRDFIESRFARPYL